MSDRLLVSTRKGLFTIERKDGAWSIARVDFLADNVTLALRDRARRAYLRRAQSRPFRRQAASFHRRRLGGDRRARLSRQTRGPRSTRTVGARTSPIRCIEIFSLATGGPDEPGLLWCGTIPGGLFRSRDHGASWELIRSLWDHPKRQKWMGGGTEWPAIHSICVDPRDARDRARRRLLRRRLGDARRRRRLGLQGGRHVRRLHAARPGPRPGYPGPALSGAKPERAGSALGAAPQRHLPKRRRFAKLGRGDRRAALLLRLRRRGASQGTRHRVVRARRQGRAAHSRRRQTRRHPHPRRRQEFRRAARRPAASSTPTTSSIATRCRSTRPATVSPSAPPLAASGSARTRATIGASSVIRCRRSMRCASSLESRSRQFGTIRSRVRRRLTPARRRVLLSGLPRVQPWSVACYSPPASFSPSAPPSRPRARSPFPRPPPRRRTA